MRLSWRDGIKLEKRKEIVTVIGIALERVDNVPQTKYLVLAVMLGLCAVDTIGQPLLKRWVGLLGGQINGTYWENVGVETA